MTIIHAEIIPSDLKANRIEAEVVATMDDGSKQSVFKYFDDELRFTPTDFLGKTIDEAYELKQRKDTAYLRS